MDLQLVENFLNNNISTQIFVYLLFVSMDRIIKKSKSNELLHPYSLNTSQRYVDHINFDIPFKMLRWSFRACQIFSAIVAMIFYSQQDNRLLRDNNLIGVMLGVK